MSFLPYIFFAIKQNLWTLLFCACFLNFLFPLSGFRGWLHCVPYGVHSATMVFNLLPERQKTLTPEIGSKGLNALVIFNTGSERTTILGATKREKACRLNGFQSLV